MLLFCGFLGAHDKYKDPNAVEYNIAKVIMHKSYNMRVSNDVALLKLENPVVLSAKVGTICLPKQSDRIPAGKKCWMTGKSLSSSSFCGRLGNGSLILLFANLKSVCLSCDVTLTRFAIVYLQLD